MSDQIKHECGFALLRLRKPLDYFTTHYGSWEYGLNKLYLLMEKQHNRGQDGAGFATVKLNPKLGKAYIDRLRSNSSQPLLDIYDQLNNLFENIQQKNINRFHDPYWAKENVPFAGEVYLGHLRYGTFGKNEIEHIHPVIRENNWKTRNLVLAGNFNLTNVQELFNHLIELGQHPKANSDTVTMLEKIGHFLDEEVEKLFRKYKDLGYNNHEITELISKEVDIKKVLNNASWRWDGGFVVAGMIGTGDAFALRDPWGIRPAYYYCNDEIAVVTSERPVIQTVFNAPFEAIKELAPGHAIIIRHFNEISVERVIEPYIKKSCSFEKIYFSRGTDKDIYNERKKLGKLIAPKVLKAINYDLKNTVFSFIPNTAAVAFYGLIESIRDYCNNFKKEFILSKKNLEASELEQIIEIKPRVEILAVKDLKLRTFISKDDGRNDLVAHIYDVTYGIVKEYEDTLVIVDDSIVRGTTLRESILKMLDRLKPKKIIIVTSAPQIRYPDCYGIDMAKLSDLVAFQAAIELLYETKQEKIIDNVYKLCKEQQNKAKEEIVNYVKLIYKPFTVEEISSKIAQIVKPQNISAKVELIFNSIENLHEACPNNTGDWYFTGNYPTPGGNKVVNNAFINYIEKINERAY